ncbi:MAG TPA: DUF6496 domain-containing protein [Chitinophagaceae bacterium]|jgi:hypothetical protein|nr:DUF6496 domain-containing protein [Chitinophagaceae bacterium]
MAKYSKSAGDKVGEAMHEMKEGKLKSGSGKKVTSPKQAIAIALSEAREEGAKVPKKTASKKGSSSKAAGKKTASKKASVKKASAKKGAAKRS